MDFVHYKPNPNELGLRNHSLHGEWEGFQSIDITADHRAIYKEIHAGEDVSAYFIALGTHKELYK